MKNTLIFTGLFLLFTSSIIAQGKLQVELKDAAKADVYIDGKKYDYAIFELLDQSKIASVNVIKDAQALKAYNAPNGVIIVKTKRADQQLASVDDKVGDLPEGNTAPLVMINGKVSNKATLSKLSPSDIKAIEVLKGEQAMKQYKAPNGVIIVTTKKDKNPG